MFYAIIMAETQIMATKDKEEIDYKRCTCRNIQRAPFFKIETGYASDQQGKSKGRE